MVPIELDGRCALVTGASQGIGRACAEWLARAGAAVCLTARNAENLEAAAAGIHEGGGRAEALPADLTGAGEAERVVAAAVRRMGGLDILVNVAGVSRRTDPIVTTDEDIDLATGLKLRAAVRLTRAAIPHIRARGGGSIVFTGGLSQQQTSEFHGSGSIANAGLGAYKHQLARRLAPEGIRVNMLNPGAIATPRMERQHHRLAELTGKSLSEVEADRRAPIPAGRFGTPEDCAKVVLFLVSDLAGYVTGQAINADGGESAAVRY